MKTFITILCFTVAISLTSCTSSKKADHIEDQVMEPRFAGYYTLTELGEENVSLNRPTFNIDPNLKRITGFSGCNSYNASYTYTSGKLQISSPLTTSGGCDTGKNLEKVFKKTLVKANSFTIIKKQLTLYDAAQNVLLRAKPTDM